MHFGQNRDFVYIFFYTGDRTLIETLKIGVVGFSQTNFNQEKARTLLAQSIQYFQTKFPSKTIEIVSGLTNVGIPKIAYEIAVENNFVTVGISAQQAFKVDCGVFPVDKQIIKGEKFGDESPYFLDYIDCLIRIGGGKQSHQETIEFKEKNDNWQEVLIEKEIE